MVVANDSVNDFILTQGDKFLLAHCDRIFKKGGIPSGKLKNALASMGSASLSSIGLFPTAEDVLFLVDTTVWGGAREGILVTDKGIYFKDFAEAPHFLKLSDIKNCTAIDSHLHINGRIFIINIAMVDSSFREPLAKFIESICTENIASTSKKKTVETMQSTVVKKSVTKDDTNNIDANVLPLTASVNDFILSQGDKFHLAHCDRIFKKGGIPSGKLNNALVSMGSASLSSIGLFPSAENILFLVDTTVWGGAKEGILVTDEGIFFKDFAEAPRFLKRSDIKKCTAIDSHLHINGGNFIINIAMVDSSFREPLANFIESICTENINLNRIKSVMKDGSNNESKNVASISNKKTVKTRRSTVVKKSVMEDDTNNIDVNALPFRDILDYRKALEIKDISEIKILRRTEYRIFFSNSDAELFKRLNSKQDILIHFVTRMCLDFVLIHNDCNNKYRKLILQDPRTFLSLFETMFNYHKSWVRDFCNDLRRDVSLQSSYEDAKYLNSVLDLMAVNLLYGEVSSVEKPMLEYSIKRGVFDEFDLDRRNSYKDWSDFFKTLVEMDKSTWMDISNLLDNRILPKLNLEGLENIEENKTLIHDSIMDVTYKWYDSHETYMCYYLTTVYNSLV